MKRLLLFLFVLISQNAFSQFEGSKQIYESTSLQEKIPTHKIIAILPFDAKITYKKQPKNFSVEANREQELALAKNLQSSMYTFLLS